MVLLSLQLFYAKEHGEVYINTNYFYACIYTHICMERKNNRVGSYFSELSVKGRKSHTAVLPEKKYLLD